MDLLEKKALYEAIDILENGRLIELNPVRELCLLLLRECTPYLGAHGRVEKALDTFVEDAA